MVAGVLSNFDIAAALENKLLISICAGVTLSTLASYLPNSNNSTSAAVTFAAGEITVIEARSCAAVLGITRTHRVELERH